MDRSAASAAFIFSLFIGGFSALFSNILRERFDGVPAAKVMDVESNPQLESDIIDEEKAIPSVFLTEFNKVSNSTINDLATADSVTILGDCIACRQKFSWRGPNISAELDEFLSETMNSARGKIRCPNCDNVLQLTFKEESP